MDKLCSSRRAVDISEPILAEDSTFSTLSLSLNAILEQLNNDAIHHDYLVALLLVLLAESGFRVSSNSNTLKREQNTRLVHIPTDWKSLETGVYEVRLVLYNLENVESKFIAIPYGDKLIVNMFPCVKEKMIYSLIVQTLKYVNPYSLCLRYLNLKEISHRFKDKLIIPVRSDILSVSDSMGPSFQGLPIELKLEIVTMLPLPDVECLALCSKELHRLCTAHLLKRKRKKNS